MRDFLAELKKHGHARGHFLGLLNVVIGRRVQRSDGTAVASGVTWRDVAALLKKVRWDKQAIRELELKPKDLPQRDRLRYWYTVIGLAQVDSPKAIREGDRFAEVLKKLGYTVDPARAERAEIGLSH